MIVSYSTIPIGGILLNTKDNINSAWSLSIGLMFDDKEEKL